MAIYRYKARDIEAKAFSGELEARDVEDAVLKLKAQNLFTLKLQEKPEKKTRFVMKSKQLSEFSKELSLMLRSGLTIVKALNIIANNETTNKKVKVVYQKLHKSLKNGVALSDAMREQGDTFPELIINMFYSGEISGGMGDVAEKMSDYYMADYRLRKKISQATTYPKILGGLTVVALIVIFIFVIPTILDMLEGQKLPVITQFMANISDYVVYKWYNVLIGIVVVILLYRYLKTIKKLRYIVDKQLLKIAVVGPLLRTIYTARFARTVSSLYGSGIQLVTALGVSSKIIGNLYVEGQLPEAIKKIRNGEMLSKSLSETDGFNNKLNSILVIGEETGKLDDILNVAASSFEYDADVAITSLLGMLEPALLVVMALVIGSVIISVLLPIFQMYDSVGGM